MNNGSSFLKLIATVILLTSSAVHAQSPPMTIKGIVKAVTDTSVTVAVAGTKDEAVMKLAPNWLLVESAPGKLTDIKSGSMIGTTNLDVEGGGRSTEVHIFAPGMDARAGQFEMDAKTGTKMTNGEVGTVTEASGGPELDISFPGGTRHVKVPPTASITTVKQLDRAQLKVGYVVSVSAVQLADDSLMARFISTGPNGSAPPM